MGQLSGSVKATQLGRSALFALILLSTLGSGVNTTRTMAAQSSLPSFAAGASNVASISPAVRDVQPTPPSNPTILLVDSFARDLSAGLDGAPLWRAFYLKAKLRHLPYLTSPATDRQVEDRPARRPVQRGATSVTAAACTNRSNRLATITAIPEVIVKGYAQFGETYRRVDKHNHLVYSSQSEYRGRVATFSVSDVRAQACNFQALVQWKTSFDGNTHAYFTGDPNAILTGGVTLPHISPVDRSPLIRRIKPGYFAIYSHFAFESPAVMHVVVTVFRKGRSFQLHDQKFYTYDGGAVVTSTFQVYQSSSHTYSNSEDPTVLPTAPSYWAERARATRDADSNRCRGWSDPAGNCIDAISTLLVHANDPSWVSTFYATWWASGRYSDVGSYYQLYDGDGLGGHGLNPARDRPLPNGTEEQINQGAIDTLARSVVMALSWTTPSSDVSDGILHALLSGYARTAGQMDQINTLLAMLDANASATSTLLRYASSNTIDKYKDDSRFIHLASIYVADNIAEYVANSDQLDPRNQKLLNIAATDLDIAEQAAGVWIASHMPHPLVTCMICADYNVRALGPVETWARQSGSLMGNLAASRRRYWDGVATGRYDEQASNLSVRWACGFWAASTLFGYALAIPGLQAPASVGATLSAGLGAVLTYAATLVPPPSRDVPTWGEITRDRKTLLRLIALQLVATHSLWYNKHLIDPGRRRYQSQIDLIAQEEEKDTLGPKLDKTCASDPYLLGNGDGHSSDANACSKIFLPLLSDLNSVLSVTQYGHGSSAPQSPRAGVSAALSGARQLVSTSLSVRTVIDYKKPKPLTVGSSIAVSGQLFHPHARLVVVLFSCDRASCASPILLQTHPVSLFANEDGTFEAQATIPPSIRVSAGAQYYLAAVDIQSLLKLNSLLLQANLESFVANLASSSQGNANSLLSQLVAENNIAISAVSLAPTQLIDIGSLGVNTPNGCPRSWTCQDIGSPHVTGTQVLTTTTDSITWTVQGAGGIGNNADIFHYMWQPLRGDGTARARVTGATTIGQYEAADAGVMLRASSDPDAPYYFAYFVPTFQGSIVFVDYRDGQGHTTQRLVDLRPRGVPVYLGVTRAGNSFTAYTSDDGATWAPLNGSRVTLAVMGHTVEAGLAAASFQIGWLTTATFDHVSVGNNAFAPVPDTCPHGWTCQDIGAGWPGTQALTTAADSITWTVQGAGGIANNADTFHYVWQPLRGDGTARARVTGLTTNGEYESAQAGVMLRASSDPGAPYYFAYFVPTFQGGIVFVDYRDGQGHTTQRLVDLRPRNAPVYLGVARSGTTFTAYTSDDGTTWAPLNGSGVNLMAMGHGVEAGLAVASNMTGFLSTATFDHVSVGS